MAPAADIFDVNPPAGPEPRGVARIGRPVEPATAHRLELTNVFHVRRTRAVTAAVLALAGALFFGFPGWAVIVLPVAAAAVPCVAEPAVLRWTLWSVLIAADGAEATLPFTWESRFVVLLLLVAPLLSYTGFVLRTI